jgi:hypothetical protein
MEPRTVLSTEAGKLGAFDCQFELMSDGTTRIKNYSGDASLLFAKAGFGHHYDVATDTITMHLGMQVHKGGSTAIFTDAEVKVKAGESDDNSELVKEFKRNGMGNAKNDFRPTDKEYQQILTLMGKEFPKEMIKVYQTISCDSKVDRHFDNFSLKSGSKIAKWGFDQPVMDDHNYRAAANVHGKIFDGAVNKNDDSGFDVCHKFYMLDTPENQPYILGYESGINNKLSIGIRMSRKDYLCSECNKPFLAVDEKFNYEWCGHYPGMELKNGKTVTGCINDIRDFLELSRVTVPAQKNAAVRKALSLSISANDSDVKSASNHSEGINSMLAKIPSELDRNKGESAMEPKTQDAGATPPAANEAKNDQPPAAPPAAAPAAPASEVKTEGAETADALVKAASALEAANATIKSLNDAVGAVVEQVGKLSEKVEGISKANETAKADLTARQELLEKHVGEGRELLTKIGEAHLSLVKTCTSLTAKSNEDIARMVGNQKHMNHRSDVEAAKQDDFYKGVQDRF